MIEVRDLSFRYPTQSHDTLSNVSLEVTPGDVVGIVGPNGSGKSTLGRVIKGLLVATRGTVRIDGIDPGVNGLEVRRRVGLLFQNPNSQIVNAVVEQEIAFGPENLGLPPTEIRHRVHEALRAVDLQGHEQAECHSLSMARKQRIALASVMALYPDYLILDEPTAWLEPSGRWQLLDEVLRWAVDRGVGLVLVTHRMDEAQMCRRLYGMLDGRIEVVGPPETVLRDARVRQRLALEVPETLVLADDLRAAGLPVRGFGGIEHLVEDLCRS